MKTFSQISLSIAVAGLLAACSGAEPAAPSGTPPAPGASATTVVATAASTEAPAITGAPSRTAPPTQSPEAPTATRPAATDTAVPATTGPAAAASITLTVTMDDMRFQPDELTVRAGETVHLDLENPDRLEHALVIADAGVSQAVAPGATRGLDFVVNLPPGSYPIFCPISDEEGNHQANGMVGTLVVEAAP